MATLSMPNVRQHIAASKTQRRTQNITLIIIIPGDNIVFETQRLAASLLKYRISNSD